MYQAVIVIHILLGLSIIGLILIQQGKGADAGAGFGGGASGSVFGAQGAASFLSRTTAILATCFFVTSLGLAWMNGNKTGSNTDFMSSFSPEEKVITELGLPDVKDAKPEATTAPAVQVPAASEKPIAVPPASPAPVPAPPAGAAPAPAPVAETPATPAPEPKAEPKVIEKEAETVKEKELEAKQPTARHESEKAKKKK